MPDLMIDKAHDEKRQGEAFAPFKRDSTPWRKKFYIESYGCAMNFADSEVVASILNKEGFGATPVAADADLILVNTCSIREKAEQTIRKRLTDFKKIKKNKPGTLVSDVQGRNVMQTQVALHDNPGTRKGIIRTQGGKDDHVYGFGF